ncbi:MAG: CoA ester lyase [Pseudomonadota bacterium]
MIRLRRSILYVPADNARALKKAASLGADAYIVDLEDAVAPDRKDAARQAACANDLEETGKEVALRINAAATPWHEADLAAARGADVAAIVLPKVMRAADVEQVAAATGHTVWPMIETPQAVLNAASIAAAAAATGPAALVLGTNDLAAELGVIVGASRAELAFALQQAVLAAKAARIDAIDGVLNALDDAPRLSREAAAGRALGMSGKSVIHPRQIAPVNAAFSPTADEIEQAREVVEAMAGAERASRSVATLNGRLVEPLHARAAQALLDAARAIEDEDSQDKDRP